jgi:hypothetical protein
MNEEARRWRSLTYVSLRLAKNYLDLLTATKPEGFLSKLGLTLKFDEVLSVGVDKGLSPRELSTDNVFAIARALDEGLRGTYIDLTTGVDPGTVTKGRVVKATLLFQHAHMQIQNYDLVHPMRDPYSVVGYSSIDYIEGIGRVFVGLVGSQYNLLSWPGDGSRGAGHSASSAEGLYEMIQYTKEKAYGEDINQRRLDRDLPPYYHDASDAQRLRAVASTFKGYDVQSVPRPVEVLFEVHYVARQVDLEALAPHFDGGNRVDLAIFGAPIWIREATEQEVVSPTDDLSDVGGVEERWVALDEELRHHITDKDYFSTWVPSCADDWRHFTRWARAWATRLWPHTEDLLWRPRERRLFGLLKGDGIGVPVPSGIRGWYVHDMSDFGFLLSLDGGLYPAHARSAQHIPGILTLPSEHDVVIYNLDGDPEPLAWDQEDVGEGVAAIFKSLTRWQLPFSDRRTSRRQRP